MTNDQITLLIIKGHISGLKPEDQAKVTACADQLRATLKEEGELGVIAFALVGAEMAEPQFGGLQ